MQALNAAKEYQPKQESHEDQSPDIAFTLRYLTQEMPIYACPEYWTLEKSVCNIILMKHQLVHGQALGKS
jgi:hypothetical protein